MEGLMESFEESTKGSVDVTFTQASMRAFVESCEEVSSVEALVESSVEVVSMESSVQATKSSVEVSTTKHFGEASVQVVLEAFVEALVGVTSMKLFVWNLLPWKRSW